MVSGSILVRREMLDARRGECQAAPHTKCNAAHHPPFGRMVWVVTLGESARDAGRWGVVALELRELVVIVSLGDSEGLHL
jgi:hypothetical protein